ncbi:uncharacterized protein E0L32_008276 [Thyridium curvatum]|uniref:Prolyl 4-hydroxylase alpha subunit domain-containing protein n=1 Tax=Thyridium curvatum TaxID=1093900 RepID=A0A507ATC4_9PEZI|nr:uncharacterized protein E0L32_008276 [Thyridium curvatum]TPX10707.1 hypothetical protein E0L32_008276 [Thyridium curvatum]
MIDLSDADPEHKLDASPSPGDVLPVPGKPIRVDYKSKDVAVPPDFLVAAPPDAAGPITISHVDWAATPLPEREGMFACVLDNVASPSECAALLRLAESSVAADYEGKIRAGESWQPALVNVGGGWEVLEPEYRNSDRIIWDDQAVVDRLWERCLRAPGLRERLAVVDDDDEVVLGPSPSRRKMVRRWEMRGLNRRMRFLRYGADQFFAPHCDAAYREPGTDKVVQTLFTVHLYLNDSKQAVGDSAELVGGATSFLPSNGSRKVDVDPKAGRVLIFQHRGLYHSGAVVEKGLKYTMRSDLLYELVERDGQEEEAQ